jgi:hypothetical protein
MGQIIKHHGYSFHLDCTGWPKQADLEKCSEMMEGVLLAWNVDTTAANHRLLTQALNEEIDWEEPAVSEINQLFDNCTLKMFEDCAIYPEFEPDGQCTVTAA